MALPLSGPISISDFNTILGRASTTADSRLAGASTPAVGSLVWIAGQAGGGLDQSAPHAFSEWYGYEPSATTSTTTTAFVNDNPIFLNSSQSTGTSITLPTGLQQNDVIVICSMSDDTTQNLPTGYTNGQNGTTNSVNYRWSYKRMGATPDTTATGLSSSSIHIALAFRDVSTATVLGGTTPAITTGTSGMPNPPTQITTSYDDCLIIILGFLDDDLVTATAPVNFTLFRSANYGSAGNGGTVMAAGDVSPTAGLYLTNGAFGGGGSDSWVGAVFSLRGVFS